MKAQQYNELQNQIIEKLNNKYELHNIINENKSLINEIVQKVGSGSAFLTKPYDILCNEGNYDLASFYQTEIENVNEVALFGEDG